MVSRIASTCVVIAMLAPGLSTRVARAQSKQDQSTVNTIGQASYVYGGQKVELRVDAGRVAVFVDGGTDLKQLTQSLAYSGSERVAIAEAGAVNWWLVEPVEAAATDSNLDSFIQKLLSAPGVNFVSPVLLTPSGGWMAVTQDILIRLKPGNRDWVTRIMPSGSLSTGELEENFGGLDRAFRVRVTFRNGFEVLNLANQLASDPGVEWAEPDMLASVTKHLVPNDPGWYYLWGLNNVGQNGGTVDRDMDCDSAWDISIGDPQIKVLILDDGVDLLHPDLNLAGGADFTGYGTGGNPYNSCDNHGTAVSGCVAAVINNHTGTIGAAPGCRVLAAKFTVSNVPCDGGGTFQFSWLVSALNWGQQQGARVSSNSNGLPVSSSVTAKYQQTYASGMVHFASAGNDGIESIGYPASLPEVNAISAINRYGNKASFSSYGADLSLTAPGQSIYTTDRWGSAGYGSGNEVTVDGTSFSAPYAAAVAALLLSVDPWLTAPEVEDQLHATAMDLGAAGFDNYYGYGLVNALGAIAHARFDVSADLTLGPAPLTVNFTGSTARSATDWEWNFGDGETTPDQNPTHSYAQPGYYTVAATVQTAERPITKSFPGMISVYADTLEVGSNRFHGTSSFLEVYARNYLPLNKIEIPFVYQGNISLMFDSVETSGLRSDFMIASITGYSATEKRAVAQLSTTNQQYLQPGAGPVARLWFTLLQPGTSGSVPVVVGYPDRNLSFTTYAGNYQPISRDGLIESSCCQGIVGDVNGDGQFEPTISDIQYIVAHLFINGVPINCNSEADANQSGGTYPTAKDITISDVSKLVDHLFITRAFLPECL